MPDYIHITTHERRLSANPPTLPGGTSAWLLVSDWSTVDAIPARYLVVESTGVREMNSAEKDAALPSWKTERIRALAAAATAYGLSHYPESQAAALRDEYTQARVDARTAAVAYLQPWIDFDRAITAEYRTRRDAILAVTTATWEAVEAAASLDFSALDAQAPSPPRSLSDAREMT